MERLIEAVGENFGAILSGIFVLAGTVLGWVLTQLTMKLQDRPHLVFAPEGTPNDELTEPELRTKTSASELSIRICNVGKVPCFLDKFYILRKGYTLVECYDVCEDCTAIPPGGSILYTVMEQDNDTLQYKYSEYYKNPNKVYLSLIGHLRKIPVLRYFIKDPQYRQGECKIIAYTIGGEKICGKIDMPLLYIRHTIRV